MLVIHPVQDNQKLTEPLGKRITTHEHHDENFITVFDDFDNFTVLLKFYIRLFSRFKANVYGSRSNNWRIFVELNTNSSEHLNRT
jgi:hypothetical protein